MDETFIKLYRKILNNRELMRDHTALAVFVWLLLRADYKTGKVETGRFVASEQLGLKPGTFYSALTRLRQRKMTTQVSNNRFTTISIVNWHKFQGVNNSPVNNKSTTNQQQINTIQEVKNTRSKEIREEKRPHLYKEGEVSDETCKGIAEKYNIDPLVAKKKRDQMELWSGSAGHKKVDWKLTLMSWIREDIDTGKISHLPAKQKEQERPDNSKGLAKFQELKSMFTIGGSNGG